MPTTTASPASLHDIWQHHYNGDFADGVRLLSENNPTAVTPTIMQRLQKLAFTGKGVSRYETGKLAEALLETFVVDAPQGASPAPRQKPSAAPPEKNTTAPAPVAPVNAGDETSSIPATAEEPRITSDRARELHKEHAHIHALMVNATIDADRARYAKDIVERINPALDAEYDRLRGVNPSVEAEAGELPDNSTPGPILNNTDAGNFKKLQSVRSRISRLKKELIPAATDPKRKEKLEKELTEKIEERKRLEKALA